LLQTHAWGLFVFSLADANESVDEHEIELYLYRIYIYTIEWNTATLGMAIAWVVGLVTRQVGKNVYNVLRLQI